ncbi:MAG: hypothetical protein C0490_19590 [Marivirga sp.]|nr:hypothetical protein [Marivirga sp.]
MEKELIVDKFIKKFILEDRRERVDFELRDIKKRDLFIDRLNHTYDKVLDMKYFQRLDPKLENPELIQKEIKLRDTDFCYVISHYSEFDDKIIDFKTAFDGIYGKGFGSLIINLSADRVYLETELEFGSQKRYIGKRLDQK